MENSKKLTGWSRVLANAMIVLMFGGLVLSGMTVGSALTMNEAQAFIDSTPTFKNLTLAQVCDKGLVEIFVDDTNPEVFAAFKSPISTAAIQVEGRPFSASFITADSTFPYFRKGQSHKTRMVFQLDEAPLLVSAKRLDGRSMLHLSTVEPTCAVLGSVVGAQLQLQGETHQFAFGEAVVEVPASIGSALAEVILQTPSGETTQGWAVVWNCGIGDGTCRTELLRARTFDQ